MSHASQVVEVKVIQGKGVEPGGPPAPEVSEFRAVGTPETPITKDEFVAALNSAVEQAVAFLQGFLDYGPAPDVEGPERTSD